jgi:[acyl-carrier-protein] S-malonyltransferase
MSKKTAFLFPGQGSQSVGMLQDLYQAKPAAKAVLDQVNGVLGRDLLATIFSGPEEALKDTFNTQPALYAAGLAVYACLAEAGIHADYLAGHSLGEYCALQAAGVFSFADGLKLVQARATAMAEAAKAQPGTMAAIMKMADADVEALCVEASAAGAVQPANYNCPGQLVISGTEAGVAKAMELAKPKGGRAIALAVSGPFHSRAMQPAGEKLKDAFAGAAWSNPGTPVVANVDAAPVKDVADIQAKLVAQVSGAVRWTQTIQYLRSQGVERFVEVGPGKVLSGLVKKIDESAETFNVNDTASLEAALAALRA